VVLLDGHRLLDDYRPSVDLWNHEMDRAPGDLDAVRDCLLLSSHAGKGRKERGMYVHHSSLVGLDELLRKYPHEACQQDEPALGPDSVAPEDLGQLRVVLLSWDSLA